MKYLYIVFLATLLGCQHKTTKYVGHEIWPGEEINRLKNEVSSGNSEAAFKLWRYYAFNRHDDRQATIYQIAAAQLGNNNAKYNLAHEIKLEGKNYQSFGSTEEEVVRMLWDDSCEEVPMACQSLGQAIEERYLDYNPQLARHYYQLGAELGGRQCWLALAELMRKGVGGPVDNVGAYYWISLDAQIIHPESISGKQTWIKRNEVAKLLSYEELSQVWHIIDSYMSAYVAWEDRAPKEYYFYPNMSEVERDNYRENIKNKENKHRSAFHEMNRSKEAP